MRASTNDLQQESFAESYRGLVGDRRRGRVIFGVWVFCEDLEEIEIFWRRINRVVAELLWLELVWLIDWWAGVQIKLFTDTESFRIMGKEHALVISNYKSDIDWLVGWVLAQRFGCLGSSLAVMKKSSKFLLVAGAKLMASLMASEAAILESIVGGLLDARTVLSSILSSSDSSPEVQQKSSGGGCYEKRKP
ncbi:hypothetical protein RHGRI_006341 [Rhododendron griersonianum]|uniref:Uncharacterized protein n=1 Tax=Rhododendron griersonianum TaxID=479676 RepID=A0AAV6KU66_9ERIC|nr:hypothetical protein RHGRI_006341 [Rhododendron griersonianum]